MQTFVSTFGANGRSYHRVEREERHKNESLLLHHCYRRGVPMKKEGQVMSSFNPCIKGMKYTLRNR